MKIIKYILIVMIISTMVFSVVGASNQSPCTGKWFDTHPKLKQECLHNLAFIDKRGETCAQHLEKIFCTSSIHSIQKYCSASIKEYCQNTKWETGEPEPYPQPYP